MDDLYHELCDAINSMKETQAKQDAIAARLADVEKEIEILNGRVKFAEHTCLVVFDNLIRSTQGFIDSMYADGESAKEDSNA